MAKHIPSYGVNGFGPKVTPLGGGFRPLAWRDVLVTATKKTVKKRFQGWDLSVTFSDDLARIIFGMDLSDKRVSFQYDARNVRVLLQLDPTGFVLSKQGKKAKSHHFTYLAKCPADRLGISDIVMSDIRKNPRIDPPYIYLESDNAVILELGDE